MDVDNQHLTIVANIEGGIVSYSPSSVSVQHLYEVIKSGYSIEHLIVEGPRSVKEAEGVSDGIGRMMKWLTSLVSIVRKLEMKLTNTPGWFGRDNIKAILAEGRGLESLKVECPFRSNYASDLDDYEMYMKLAPRLKVLDVTGRVSCWNSANVFFEAVENGKTDVARLVQTCSSFVQEIVPVSERSDKDEDEHNRVQHRKKRFISALEHVSTGRILEALAHTGLDSEMVRACASVLIERKYIGETPESRVDKEATEKIEDMVRLYIWRVPSFLAALCAVIPVGWRLVQFPAALAYVRAWHDELSDRGITDRIRQACLASMLLRCDAEWEWSNYTGLPLCVCDRNTYKRAIKDAADILVPPEMSQRQYGRPAVIDDDMIRKLVMSGRGAYDVVVRHVAPARDTRGTHMENRGTVDEEIDDCTERLLSSANHHRLDAYIPTMTTTVGCIKYECTRLWFYKDALLPGCVRTLKALVDYVNSELCVILGDSRWKSVLPTLKSQTIVDCVDWMANWTVPTVGMSEWKRVEKVLVGLQEKTRAFTEAYKTARSDFEADK